MQGIFCPVPYFRTVNHDWHSFNESLKEASPPAHYHLLLKALWMEAKGDWSAAHDLVDELTTTDGAWVHAYFHRVEGDLSNADYWYRRANRKRPAYSLPEERKVLVEYFLNQQ
jgi:hypothetical protein